MDPLTIGLITGGANLLGSLFSSETSASNTAMQSQKQMAMQKESEQFNAGQAQLNRDYQTQMSNTAYQRASADMKSAGLNPMMMANGSMNASTPSGSSASVSTPSAPMPQNKSPLGDIGDTVNKVVSTAIQAKTYDKMTDEISNLQTQGAKMAAETDLVKQRKETETQETLKAATDASLKQFALPGARFSAKQAEDLAELPDWLRKAASQGSYVGGKASQAIEPLTDLISSAKGVKSLLQYPDSPTRKYHSFEDRWP